MLPRDFSDRMQRMLGEEFETFLEAFEREKYQGLRLNTLKTGVNGRSAAELPEGRSGCGAGTEAGVRQDTDYDTGTDRKTSVAETGFAHLSKVSWAENCYYYEAADQPGKHPYHAAGVYYIQEPSAMAPAGLLDVRPGERVLDLCAAPGGKSTQIAAGLGGEGFLLCNEISPARAKILSENVERMGIVNAYVTNETPARLAELFPGYFDKILVDAPCSGEGMFRKNEAACEEWSLENVAMCAQRQDDILDCAARMLRPGGKLVYSTCTFAPAENEGSVGRFLGRHTEFFLLPINKEQLGLSGCDGRADYLENCLEPLSEYPEAEDRLPGENSQDNEGKFTETVRMANAGQLVETFRKGNEVQFTDHMEYTLRLWPHKIKGEGHFAALFQKAGELPEGHHNDSLNGVVAGVPDRELGEYFQFCQEMFGKKELPVGQNNGQPAYIRFGDNIYLVSPWMPSVKGLKVLRPGLHVGTLKKNRFEPSHALALALSPDGVKHLWNLDSRENTVISYLKGETFPAEGEKGWYLICVDGFSTGWGKLAGGIMKNHYPKGLRIT